MPPPVDAAEFLATVRGFQALEPDDLRRLAERTTFRAFAPGEFLIRKGEQGHTLFVVRRGQLRVPITDAEGHEKMVYRVGPGDLVGEMALLTGDARRNDVVADTEVEAFLIHRRSLMPLLADHPPLARFLSDILGRRIEQSGGIDRVGKYRLLGKLGEGSTGQVFEAVHPVLQRTVAIKMLSHALVFHTQFRDRFLEEARLVASLAHANIIQVFDTEAAFGTYFIVMEKLDGTDLAAVLERRGALPPAEAGAILDQMAAALEFAHARGFAHRDVKPANAVIDARGRVKLMDFGLARPIPAVLGSERAQSVDGTPQYIAPETALGRQTDGRVDVYALGVMAFEMLTGRLPFTTLKVMELLQSHVRTPPPDIRALRPDLPAGLVEFVRGTLVKDPDKRVTDWPRLRAMLRCEAADAASPGPPPAREDVIRVRYQPGAAPRVEAAVEALERALRGLPGVDIARGRMSPAGQEDSHEP
ncbi:MAG TPA: protein kinase [Myxococcota bacterium]|nr:protein kinase [Myxococcota bacterium]HRY95840.1 protein kinase [Myxococcota bacterium]HSA22807.1 protein kinase [Myxococcota bacterium]